jgi:hypothetical protein
MRPAYNISCKHGKCADNGDLVKDISMLYMHLIIIVILVAEKQKWEALLSYHPSYITQDVEINLTVSYIQ